MVDDVDGIGTNHPLLEGRIAHQLAVLYGHTEIARLLEAAGAVPLPLTPVEELRAAYLLVDRPSVERLVAGDATLAGQLVDACPDLLGKAAELDRIDVIRSLVAVGFDLNPTDRRTPLHEAAFHGHLDLVRALVARRQRPGRRTGTVARHRPKPHVGDPTYDALQHLLNCDEGLRSNPRRLARHMADLLGLDPDRLILWLFARCALESPDSTWLGDVARRLAPA